MRPSAGSVALLPLVLALAGCSDSPDPARPADASRAAKPAARATPPPTAPLRRADCPPALSNCKTASGRIIYVERVDPDGDGDAHFVLTSRQSITLPGVSVIDVEKSLRPRPLPVEGDRVSAAGPVYRGSYGQSQIEAIELYVARATRPSR